MIIYTCPDCGHDLQEFILCSNPPKTQYNCPACGWHKIEDAHEQIVRVPYGGNTIPEETFSLLDISLYEYQEKPKANGYCEFCPNHPSNGGSGICHCILGSMGDFKC